MLAFYKNLESPEKGDQLVYRSLSEIWTAACVVAYGMHNGFNILILQVSSKHRKFHSQKGCGTFGFLSYVHWCVGAYTGSVKFQVSVSCIPGISKTENVLLASTSLLLVWQCHEPVYNFIDATTCLWPCGCIRVCFPGVNQVSQLVYIRHESVTLTTAPFCFSYRGGFSSLCKEISGIS